MEKKVSRPQTTKELLLQDSLGRLEIKYRHRFASDLLCGRVSLPPHWLTPKQVAFVELDLHSLPDAGLRASALDLAAKVVRLGELVYGLVDDFTHRHQGDLLLDHKERGDLRRGRGPAAVRTVLFRRCGTWPATDPGHVPGDVRSEVDQVLRNLIQQKRAESAPANEGPRDDRHLAVWHKTRATASQEMLRRYLLYESFQDARALVAYLVVIVSTGILYIVLFLALRRLAPDLTVKEAMIVAGAPLGGAGVAAAGSLIRARRKRATASGDEPSA
jgi:hypothetical protein